jgi:hypothetical protein
LQESGIFQLSRSSEQHFISPQALTSIVGWHAVVLIDCWPLTRHDQRMLAHEVDPMRFTITWSNLAGPECARCDTAGEALDIVVRLAGQGFQDVVILDRSGKAYASANFSQFFIDTAFARRRCD